MYHQYGDLPQIPSFPDDHQYGAWTHDHTLAYRQHPFRVEEDFDYSGVDDGAMVRLQTMERFLLDTSPLTPGLLQAKFDRSVPLSSQHLGTFERQWPAPELRFNSPGLSSQSGYSSHATENELRSPHPFHSIPYGSSEELSQPTIPYPTADRLNEPTYSSDLTLPGGNVSLRDIEYEHQDPEPTTEENDAVDMKTDNGYEPEPVYVKTDSAPESYKNYPDSGVGTSLRDAESVQPMEPSEEDSSDQEYTPNRQSRRRQSSASSGSGQRSQRRRNHGRKSSTTSTPAQTNRVSKRAGRGNASLSASKASSEVQANGDAQRHFPCPLANYGCQSTFSSKNEWKRHVSTQHVKLGFWRCDLCAETVDPHDERTVYHNDFNRKDLFTQHLRRMHAAPPNQSARSQREYPVTEENIGEHQSRCYQKLRDAPPQSRCLFCDETFSGPSSWENRIEHVGRHLEKDRKAGLKLQGIPDWNADKTLEQWLIAEGLVEVDRSGVWKIGDGRRRCTVEEESEDDA
ncbi:hypothetical protein BU26DRAFT_213249 [Trematosphaeria pertusa]|uniref:C2H2-type domain-containing protein n=1 Tax=Trematosphaeria pertusa TaxID=390896 RepID=A0A6A6IR63_9PLEO|nr:uncharacterized protein BU26DRAFT_213249 [Trematosphaeria pertusa]KAF2253024.1 hypothetical protein BU26DRAFT_213249 [Trematosphaeria pertusa]